MNSQPTNELELDRLALKLFLNSLEQPAAQRTDWLTQQCSDSPELLEKVLALREAESRSSGFLEDGPRTHPASWVLDDRAGQRLGAFELIEMLAIGGMSTVYRARRADGAFDQQVAVKLFEAASLDAQSRRRFDAERRILATLEHPGIARIIDGGAADDGTPYVVIELVQGEPITHYCRRHSTSVEGRLTLLQQLCDAVNVAHRQGIVHRDIKAGNVLVTNDGVPKLIDFGIARALDNSAVLVDLPETRLGSQLMTPEYASPEQIRGEKVGISSDVYSLGVLAYELLTGTRPYQLAGMSPAEIERMVCFTIPCDPSTSVAQRRTATAAGLDNPRRLRKRLRGDIDRIVMTALHHTSAQRYPTAQALADDIERHLSGKPVKARGASGIYRISRFLSRYRVGVAATATVFVALATALIMVENQRELASQQAARAEAARGFLVDMIQRADPFENAVAPTLAGALKLALDDVDMRFADQPELEADMRYTIGYALQNLGEVELARDQFEKALALRDMHNDSVKLAQIHDGLGLIAWWDSDLDRSAQQFGRAIKLLSGTAEPETDVWRVKVLANWAAMLIDAGDYEESERRADQARLLAETGDDVRTLSAIWSTLATARQGLNKNEEALAAFEQSLRLQAAATGENHPSYAILLNNLALQHHQMGRLSDAVTAMQRSVAIRRETLGIDHPQTATALFNLARLQTYSGDLGPAERNARLALDVAISGYAAGHPRIGKAHEALAIVLSARQMPEQAMVHALTARAIYQNANSVDPAWLTAVDQLIASMQEAEPHRIPE